MLLQRLATGATGVKQVRYRRGPTRGSEALYAHAQYNTQPVGPWHLLFNSWCNEFRRGFCTLVPSARMRSEGTVVVPCVCQCVQASHPLLTQLQDQVDIPMDSVSCSLQN